MTDTADLPTIEEARAEVLERMTFADSPATTQNSIDHEVVAEFEAAIRRDEYRRGWNDGIKAAGGSVLLELVEESPYD